MQCVVLAAGRGTRMRSLTDTLPKPLLTIAGTTLLEYKFDILPADVDEIILIVSYLGDLIRDRFGDSYRGKRVRYVEQHNPTGGTADALWCAKEFLRDRFIVLMGDDVYDAHDLVACTRVPEWALLVSEVRGRRSGGMVVSGKDGRIVDIQEGEHDGVWDMCTNLFMLDKRIFALPPVPKSNTSKELGLPQSVLCAAGELGITLTPVPATRWTQITDPEDLAQAEASLGTPKERQKAYSEPKT